MAGTKVSADYVSNVLKDMLDPSALSLYAVPLHSMRYGPALPRAVQLMRDQVASAISS